MTYDALDRLTRVQRPASPHPEENYVYDVLDNLRQTRFGPGTGALTFDYTLHGSTNRMTRMTLGKGGSVLETATYGYDARGNMTTRRGHTHAYDAANRMLWANTGTQTENYRYDGHGRRTRIQRAGGNTYQVYGLDGKLLYERAPNGTTTRHAYLGNRRVASIQGATTRYHHTNHLGSVIVTTNADGGQHRRQVYASYGSAWDSADYAQAPGFTGHVTDLATTLHYMQQRYDDPVAMRFASVDPVHVDTTTGANFNRYAYANNNPLTYIDPDGREAICSQSSCTISCTSVLTCSADYLYVGAVIAQRHLQNAMTSQSNQQGESVSESPPAPGEIVGEQDSGSRTQGGRHNSGPLSGENGGTGDAETDFGNLTGGVSAPAPEGSRYPAGTQVGENGVIYRPGTESSGPRIDIPVSGNKPHETLHYPKNPPEAR